MLDVGVIKSVIDLFNSLLALIDRGAKERRDAFERTIKPLYGDLQRITNEYYQIIEHARVALEETDPDLSSIVRDVKSKRADMIMARNEIIGQIRLFSLCPEDLIASRTETFDQNAFNWRHDRDRLVEITDEYEALIRNFAISIADYFSNSQFLITNPEDVVTNNEVLKALGYVRLWQAEDDRDHLRHFARCVLTPLGDFIADLQAADNWLSKKPTADSKVKHDILGDLRRRADMTLSELERRWTTVAERYASVKLFCDA
jgi:hypothetical protein